MKPDSAAITPSIIFDTLTAYHKSEALKAAIELDLFTEIAQGAETSEELAERCLASPRGMRILCDYLVVIGFLTKAGNQYGLTEESSRFLDRNRPGYLGGYAHFLAAPGLMDSFHNLEEAVKQGGSSPKETIISTENPLWVRFARGMAAGAVPAAEFIAESVQADQRKTLKVLDVAAGHGMFGLTIARHNPRAEIYALDWEPVLEVARENAESAGVQDRYHLIPGDLFEVDLGSDYDLVLLTNIFHHFDKKGCIQLMERINAVMRSDGVAATLEFVPNEDRVSPPQAAGFSLVMLALTPSGEAYTSKEYGEMFEKAGFAHNEVHQIPSHPQQVILSRKRV